MKRLLVIVLVLGGAFMPLVASACPSCYGAADSPMTDGMNMAILSLLGVTASVLGGVVTFFVYMRRRMGAINRLFTNRLN